MKNALTKSFVFLFERDLTKLESEISQYADDGALWKVTGQITNPAGNLCLHLCGNLQYYLGTVLGKTGYVRNRPLEFSAKGISRDALMAEIVRTKKAVAETLGKLDDDQLAQSYPEDVLGYPMTTSFFLNHLFGHLGYHLGQVNYHRRLTTPSTR